MKVSRRHVIIGAQAAGVVAGLSAIKLVPWLLKPTAPRKGVLGDVERLNLGAQHLFMRKGAEQSVHDMTPEEAWPVYMAAPKLPVKPANWKLRVGGMVERPREFSYDDLMRLERTDCRGIEHHCVEGWSAVADWHGVRVSKLAEICGAKSVDWVEFKSFDKTEDGERYWSTWDYDSAMHPQTLVAYGMNDHLLAPEHGAPVKLYGSVKLGYKMVKWLDEINFVDRVDGDGGYWEARKYELYAGT